MPDLRILFIEDSENDVLLLLRAIEKGGYSVQWECVQTAVNMQAALARQLWDLILCDYSLPSMDAMQALETLKNSGLDLPFIIVSGTIEEEAAVSALKAGAHDFLTKNSLARLLPAIQRELKDAENRREHKRADESLRVSELRFRSTLDGMMEGCQIIGYDWRYLYINASAEKHNRRPNKELLGNVYMEMWPGIESTAVFSAIQRCMEGRTSHHMVNEFIYPDNSKGWFELNIQPAPEGVFILSSDITAHTRAVQALLEREMKLSTLFEILPVGISILDSKRKLLFTNLALKKILSLSEEELFNAAYESWEYRRADGTLMPFDERASVRAFKEKKGVDDVETGVVKENGSIVWTNVSVVPVDFPDWKAVVVTSDITVRKQAELAKYEAEERYKRLFENMQESFIIQEIVRDEMGNAIDLRYVDVNPIAERIMGRTRNEIIGQTRSQVSGQPDPEGVKMASDVATTGRSFHTIRFSPGFGGWFEAFIYSLGPNMIATLALDITERKQAEEEILKLYTELEAKVAERTAELDTANKQLRELAIIDELTGLYNRRGFLIHAEQQLLLARRARRHMLVFYADLDGLKQINDQFGHIAGDKAIIMAARALHQTFRTTDIKARLGGDEFIVLAMEAEEQDAQMLLARLSERLTDSQQSMSVGVVIVDAQKEISIDELIARADEAMYAEKRSKPNRRKI